MADENKKTAEKIETKKVEVKKVETKKSSSADVKKIVDLKIELLKNPTKRKSIKREIARLLTMVNQAKSGGTPLGVPQKIGGKK